MSLPINQPTSFKYIVDNVVVGYNWQPGFKGTLDGVNVICTPCDQGKWIECS